MLSRTIIALAFLLGAGCAGASQYTQWPYQGPMMMVKNPRPSSSSHVTAPGAS